MITGLAVAVLLTLFRSESEDGFADEGREEGAIVPGGVELDSEGGAGDERTRVSMRKVDAEPRDGRRLLPAEDAESVPVAGR